MSGTLLEMHPGTKDENSERGFSPGRALLAATRLWLPIAIALVGVAGIVIGHGRTGAAGAGVGLIIVGLIVWMINWMFRLSVASNRDRDDEEEARRYFDRHGRWPGEDQ